MMPDQMFLGIVILIGLVEAGCLCWIIEKGMKRTKAIIRDSEKRRRKHFHDYYCSQEAERLYNTFNNREGGMKNGQVQN